jgi:hypothetical protein
MKRVLQVVSEPLPILVTTEATQSTRSSIAAGHVAQPLIKVMVSAPGPLLCRCGRYLSEDFDGRLFCRGCEGTDPTDLTSRLPLCHRP